MKILSLIVRLTPGMAAGLLACAPVLDLGRTRIPTENVQVVSVEDQALAAVDEVPLAFTVSYENEAAAWQRAITFFKLYLKEEGSAPFSLHDDLIFNQASPGVRYAYRVEHRAGPQGFAFNVACQPAGAGADAIHAEQNARNLARFVRDGTLELSLLSR